MRPPPRGRLLLFFLLFGTAAAERDALEEGLQSLSLDELDGEDLQADAEQEEHGQGAGRHSVNTTRLGKDLLDISGVIFRKKQKMKDDGHKCCCDVKGGMIESGVALISKDQRTGRCMVYKTDKCKDVESPDWAKGRTLNCAHMEKDNEFCKVHPNDIEAVYNLVGSDYNYCKGRVTEEAIVTPAEMEMGDTASVKCTNKGWYAEPRHVQCAFSREFTGRFVPGVKCKKVVGWCKAFTGKSDGNPSVKVGKVWNEKKVTCGRGYKPEKTYVTCGEDRKWIPTPYCVRG